VRDAETGQTLADVIVELMDGETHTKTSRWGVYRLDCGATAHVNVRLVRSGYATTVERVSLRRTRTVADFEMTPVDAILDALIVVDEPVDLPESEGGLAVRVTDEEATNVDAHEVLKDVPGVLVLRPSGQIGSGALVRLRGIRSMFAGNEPLVYVDGVRTTSTSAMLPWIRGESALDYIPPYNIERIEVFKGPAATATFGTGALGGVIHIYTKKGPHRRPQ
jgi:outer membrane receptor protein involved in Fe transport